MPLPTPEPGESRDDFMGRCVPVATADGMENEQAAAVCMRQFESATETNGVPNAANKQVRINVRTAVNMKNIRTAQRNGRDYIIVPSATMPDDIVMNRVKYPADKIAASYHTLEKTFAPLGHPQIGDRYISAREPEAINQWHVGAHNENVRRENGRVYLDKVIDVEVAKRTEKGRMLLAAIEKREPIHTSTGILVDLIEANAQDYDYIADGMVFDHDAILLNEEGAATPAQGVGMMVNAKGEEIEAMDISLDEKAIREIAESVALEVAWRAEQEERESRMKPMIDAIMEKIRGLLKPNRAAALNANHNGDEDMTLTPEQAKALTDGIAALVANANDQAKAIGEAVAAAVKAEVAPLIESHNAMKANAEAKEKAERDGYIKTVTDANLLDAETAAGLTTNALKVLAEKAKPGAAAGIAGGFIGNAGEKDEFAGYDLNKVEV